MALDRLRVLLNIILFKLN